METLTGRKDFLLLSHLVEMADADAAVYLVEQGGTQVGELAGGDERVGVEAVVGEELSQVQTLEGGKETEQDEHEKPLENNFIKIHI